MLSYNTLEEPVNFMVYCSNRLKHNLVFSSTHCNKIAITWQMLKVVLPIYRNRFPFQVHCPLPLKQSRYCSDTMKLGPLSLSKLIELKYLSHVTTSWPINICLSWYCVLYQCDWDNAKNYYWVMNVFSKFRRVSFSCNWQYQFWQRYNELFVIYDITCIWVCINVDIK